MWGRMLRNISTEWYLQKLQAAYVYRKTVLRIALKKWKHIMPLKKQEMAGLAQTEWQVN